MKRDTVYRLLIRMLGVRVLPGSPKPLRINREIMADKRRAPRNRTIILDDAERESMSAPYSSNMRHQMGSACCVNANERDTRWSCRHHGGSCRRSRSGRGPSPAPEGRGPFSTGCLHNCAASRQRQRPSCRRHLFRVGSSKGGRTGRCRRQDCRWAGITAKSRKSSMKSPINSERVRTSAA